jgi:hypothetical protein
MTVLTLDMLQKCAVCGTLWVEHYQRNQCRTAIVHGAVDARTVYVTDQELAAAPPDASLADLAHAKLDAPPPEVCQYIQLTVTIARPKCAPEAARQRAEAALAREFRPAYTADLDVTISEHAGGTCPACPNHDG